ncbi:type II toxin-antitoxin system YhaV family toxin [Gemmatimonas sp.]|uniref:type II toxin-antitoxin system YhaV family toxin n=1 Tax=Gemmatimonas sp. TaxID=1962908 RepID=UPI003566656B
MRRNGWTLLRWDAFATSWDALVAEVVRLEAQDPDGYHDHPSTKFLKRLADVALTEIPSDPSHERYQLGTALGSDAKFWRRVKNDPYTVFRSMPVRGKPPSSWQELGEACAEWPSDSADDSVT